MRNRYQRSLIAVLLVLVLSFGNRIQAQTKHKVYYTIERALQYPQGMERYGSIQYKNKGYVFGFAISINKLGVIDTVLFSNRTKFLDSLVCFDLVEKRLKQDCKEFSKFMNTVLVGAVLVRRGWDSTIDNLQDTYQKSKARQREDFDSYFNGMIPDIDEISKTKFVKLLPSFLLIINNIEP
ncbi:hypothetical protein WG904_19400 [Pedobacter sp. Du54]|uniref:hypothetical protein n=1 Tax=Pedobacter anseongensis TaxID=3133439 RepID=UPI0030B4A774